MGYWKSKPNRYNEYGFIEIPVGDHRVQICNVKKESFKNEKKCFEITLKVSGYHGKLWYYLWYNPEKRQKTNWDFSLFFESFQINDYNIENYKDWIGKTGAVRVVSDDEITDDSFEYKCAVRVAHSLGNAHIEKLPPWKEAPKEILFSSEEKGCESSSIDLPF